MTLTATTRRQRRDSSDVITTTLDKAGKMLWLRASISTFPSHTIVLFHVDWMLVAHSLDRHGPRRPATEVHIGLAVPELLEPA